MKFIMFQKWHFSILIFTAVFLGSIKTATAQTPKSFLWEPEVEVVLPAKGDWQFTFGAANRYLFFSEVEGERVNESEQQHIELNHFTKYKTTDHAAVAFGVRYRFRETFEKSRHDELRLIQQFSYSHRGTFLSPGHRLRFEQRFRDNTIYRLRYRLGFSQPLSDEFDLGFSTEFLYSMIKDLKPGADQRFTVELENSSFDNLDLSIGLEMRREDFTRYPRTEIYLLTGASLKL